MEKRDFKEKYWGNGKIPKWIFLPWVIGLLFAGCTEDEIDRELLDENVQALATRTTVAITKCVDSYIYWNDVPIYQGTHCWTEYGSTGPGGGGVYTGGEYDPGCSYPGGGGTGNDYGTPDNPSEFRFTFLDDFYAPGSSLNLVDKQKVDNVLMSFRDYSPIYAQVYNFMLEKNVRFKCGINKELCDQYNAPALYSVDDRTLYFRSSNDISIYSIVEELIHVAQHQCIYGDDMKYRNKDCEFEAKIFQDMVNGSIENYYGITYWPTFTDESPVFGEKYVNWIDDLIKAKSFPYGERTQFRELCALWQGYPGSSHADFTPLLLDKFYRKPIPDHQ